MKYLIAIFLVTQTWAGFNFGECSGSGTFRQNIEAYNGNYEKTIKVGTIPAGIKDLYVELISDNDVDIRLYGENQDKIIHWPYGLLSGANIATAVYKNTPITYSGYNGKNGKKGHEFIKINGETTTALNLRAFGYKSGNAIVNYSWSSKKDCKPLPSGKDTFKQDILKNNSVLVGTIPSNIENVEINLSSQNDIDIQLFAADGTPIVSWKPKGLLSQATKQTIEYHGMHIEWSGYYGVNGQKGHEYIKINNTTSEVLTMKVYGYEAGLANVTYSWGVVEKRVDLAYKYGIASQGETYAPRYTAYHAIDHDDHTVSVTKNKENWFQLAFPKGIRLDTLKVTGRKGYIDRLKGARIYTLNHPYEDSSSLKKAHYIGTLKDIVEQQIFKISKENIGQYVVIRARNGQHIELTAVEAYGNVNKSLILQDKGDLAYTFATARQGSGYNNTNSHPASNAIDHNPGSFNHTDKEGNWLSVDFPKAVRVSKLIISGRKGYESRLTDAKVYLTNVPYVVNGTLKESDLVATLINSKYPQKIEIPEAKHAKYVVVKAKDGVYLHLNSLEVYGRMDSTIVTEDLAYKYGVASQGDTYAPRYLAYHAIDHDDNTVSVSKNTSNWLQVAFPEGIVSEVLMFQGRPHYQKRLEGAKVYLLESPYMSDEDLTDKNMLATLEGIVNKQWIKIDKRKHGKYILVKAKDGQNIELSSLEVYGHLDNGNKPKFTKDLAYLHGHARQGSSYHNTNKYLASNVLDNNLNTFNSTKNNSNNWLSVDFPRAMNISKIMIAGRKQYGSRLEGAKVYFLNNPYHAGDVLNENNLVATLKGSTKPQWIYLPQGKQAQSILIKARDGQYLHLGSVRAYGFMPPLVCNSDSDCGEGNICHVSKEGQAICAIPNILGNGILDENEICDDGNKNNDDMCTNTGKLNLGASGCYSDSDCATNLCDTDQSPSTCERTKKTDYVFNFEVKANYRMEAKRLFTNATHSPYHTTGLWLPQGGTLTVMVSGIKGDPKKHYVELAESLKEWRRHQLHEGENIIKVDKDARLYLRAEKSYYGDPKEKVRITISGSGISKYPLYKLGKTTQKEWQFLLNRPTNFIQLETNRLMISFDRKEIDERHTDFKALGKMYDEMVKVVERSSGIIPNDSNPLHRPDYYKYNYMVMPFGYMFTSGGLIGYTAGLTHRMINVDEARSFWGNWHEMGHTLQSPGITWSGQGEVSVNVSAFASRAYTMSLDALVLFYDSYFKKAFDALAEVKSYDELPQWQREYMYHHLFFIFGEKFWYKLNRLYRENMANPELDSDFVLGKDNATKENIMALLASKATKTNLIDFYTFWKFPLTQSTKDKINALGYPSYTEYDRLPSELVKDRKASDFDMRF